MAIIAARPRRTNRRRNFRTNRAIGDSAIVASVYAGVALMRFLLQHRGGVARASIKRESAAERDGRLSSCTLWCAFFS